MFSSDESDFYSKLETKSKIVYNKYLTANVIGKNYSNLLVLLLRLRQDYFLNKCTGIWRAR